MAKFRLSYLARRDIAAILDVSFQNWGSFGRRRYSAVLAMAMRRAAADPHGPLTRDQEHLLPGLRSIHPRLIRTNAPSDRVKNPVHVIFFWEKEPGLIEILRVLHERMDPHRHLSKKS